jgi:hypothetical protein
MKPIAAIILLSLLSLNLQAQDWPIALQLKYSPVGSILADEDEFDYAPNEYAQYEMNFDRSIGAKLIIPPVYVSANRSITNLDDPIPDATVDTLALGIGLLGYDEYTYDAGTYFLVSLGIGAGQFKFKEPEKNDWEAMAEANAEIGLRLQEHLLLGVGIDYQHFGEPGETKARYWNLYIGTGIVF